MSWLDWLDADELADLVERFGSTREAAVKAMQRPEYADEFARSGAHLYTDPDGVLHAIVQHRSIERTFAQLVLAALGTAPPETDAGPSRRKPIPRSTLERAVQLLANGASRNETSREAGLSPRLVDGLIRDMKAGVLGWSEADRLALPPGTRATREGYVLPEHR